MNTVSVRNIVITLLASAVLTAISCQREEKAPGPATENDGSISFIVSEAKPFATKADDAPVSYTEQLFSSDSLDIYLKVTENNYHSGLFDTLKTVTKGSPYDGAHIGKFYVSSFISTESDGLGNILFKDIELDSPDNSSVKTGYYWPIGAKINFFGRAKNIDAGTVTVPVYSDARTASFEYTLPSDHTTTTTQPDLLFAISPEQTNTGSAVGLNFYHALSALTFSVGDVPGDLTINKVEFTNIRSSGSCIYKENDGGIDFEWSFDEDDEKQTYTQTFDFDLFDSDNKPLAEDTAINTSEQTFIMIPQTFTDATINIYISFADRQYTIEKKLKDITPVWKAGKQYTFKISSPEEVQVNITDEVVFENGFPVKKNLQITNSGISGAWIRASIIGNWVIPQIIDGEEHYNIIASWDIDDEIAGTGWGEFTWSGGSEPTGTATTGWRKGADGYYYYMEEVSAGDTADPLFEQYALKDFYPMSDAVLELTIAIQAIHRKDLEIVWPAEVRNDLDLL